MDRKRKDEILNIKYNNDIDYKPNSFWYNIKDSYFKNPTTNFGDYFYEIVLKTKSLSNIYNEDKNKILSINNIEDLDIFNNKYKTKFGKHTIIKWYLVAENNGGIEFKNYDKIIKILRKDKNNFYKYNWFYGFDFNSGCVWNLNIIKEKKFIKKFTIIDKNKLDKLILN